MDYEKAWKDLKRCIEISRWSSLCFAEPESSNDDMSLQVKGGRIMAKVILEYMSKVEEEETDE